jgi:hypothetical protein
MKELPRGSKAGGVVGRKSDRQAGGEDSAEPTQKCYGEADRGEPNNRDLLHRVHPV